MNILSRPYILWPLLIVVMLLLVMSIKTEHPTELRYDEFLSRLKEGRIAEVFVESEVMRGTFDDQNKTPFITSILPDSANVVIEQITDYNEAHPEAAVSIEQKNKRDWLSNPLVTMLFTVVIIVALWMFFMRQIQSNGAKAMSFGKVKTKLYGSGNDAKFTFDDVAGVEEAKEELQEVVEFLKEPDKFKRLGGRIPKGVLLFGPPGTGKTLLGKAVAGEANVPFFSISGSDFVEMFVGVGASRVRDLFETGKRNSPCIIFVDEIDAVGRHRFAGWGGGHDEREQTLNQLLVELDGFTPNDNVILIAATNRPDVLDPALLRPGRFDRRIVVDLPDLNGREAILEVHTREIKLSETVDLQVIARRTPGFSGADLANACNEAALLAARKGKEHTETNDFDEAIDRVLAGPERRSRAINDAEKAIIAYHEAGHALIGVLLDEVDPVHKVSIVSRGHAALGYTLQFPEEDRHLNSRGELVGRMTVCLGGRVAEELHFGQITTGSHNDLQQATEVAHRMVTEFGMSDEIGPVAFGQGNKPVFVGKDMARERPYSESIAFEIDKEVRALIDACHQRAQDLLTEHRDQLELLATTLLEKEVMNREEIEELLGVGGPPSEPPTAVEVVEETETVVQETKASAEDASEGLAPGIPPEPSPA